MSEREPWMPSAVKIQTAMAGGWPSVEREIRAAVEKAVAEIKTNWENAIQHERMLLADNPRYAQDAVVFALKARHARALERARLWAKIEEAEGFQEYRHDGAPECYENEPSKWCFACERLAELRAALAALEEAK